MTNATTIMIHEKPTNVVDANRRKEIKKTLRGGVASSRTLTKEQSIAIKKQNGPPTAEDVQELESMVLGTSSLEEARNIFEKLGAGIISEERFRELTNPTKPEVATPAEKEVSPVEPAEPQIVTPEAVETAPAIDDSNKETEPQATQETETTQENESLIDFIRDSMRKRNEEFRQRRSSGNQFSDVSNEDRQLIRKRQVKERRARMSPEETELEEAQDLTQEEFKPTPEMERLTQEIAAINELAYQKWEKASGYQKLTAKSLKVLEELNFLFRRWWSLYKSFENTQNLAKTEFEKKQERAKTMVAEGTFRKSQTWHDEQAQEAYTQWQRRQHRDSGTPPLSNALTEALKTPIQAKKKPALVPVKKRLQPQKEIAAISSFDSVLNKLKSKLASGQITSKEFLAKKGVIDSIHQFAKPSDELRMALVAGKLTVDEFRALKQIVENRPSNAETLKSLQLRLAKGEITTQEFTELKSKL